MTAASPEYLKGLDSRRQVAIVKLLGDVKDYLTALELIESVPCLARVCTNVSQRFITPLKQLLSPEQISSVFSNFDKIVDTTRKFHDALTTRQVCRRVGPPLTWPRRRGGSSSILLVISARRIALL